MFTSAQKFTFIAHSNKIITLQTCLNKSKHLVKTFVIISNAKLDYLGKNIYLRRHVDGSHIWNIAKVIHIYN